MACLLKLPLSMSQGLSAIREQARMLRETTLEVNSHRTYLHIRPEQEVNPTQICYLRFHILELSTRQDMTPNGEGLLALRVSFSGTDRQGLLKSEDKAGL